MNGDQANPNQPAQAVRGPAPAQLPVASPAPSPGPASDSTPSPTPAPTPTGKNQKTVVIDKLKSSSSILVAVNANPSIDQLASAIALTLLLEKLKKNATAVFSGKVPSALEFLKPKETFQTNTDSLRDFIIAIDKSKADKLRYKVEDNVVKIFITPYKTSITEKDLQYNAGDFNVDLIVALGVQHQQDLDTAITTHGRIFHDAAVVSINNVAGGDFGVANWEDSEVSSLSELIAHLATDISANLLDADIATALLTGIVAETSRFSNAKTHPETMNVSSQLLQAGADQQLVNQQLQSVISTDVNLQAGTEIKPTMSPEEQAKEFGHEDEELVIGDDGSLKSSGNLTDGAEPQKLSQDTDGEELKDEKTAGSEAEKPASAPAQSETKANNAAIEPDLVLPQGGITDDKPAAAAPAPASEPENIGTPANAVTDDAEAARKAIADALKNAAIEEENIPAAKAAEPTLTPPTIPSVQPGPGPAAPSQHGVPPIGSEPAPLANSPADQAFTMPLPPTSSLTQAPVVLPPTSPAPDAGMAPPPLPPPLPPNPA
jgi:hypothetical protein